MPLKISDTQLADAYSKLQAANKKDASVKIDDTNVLQLLAAVGDSSSSKATTMLSKLSAPGMTRQQQFDLVNKGMSKTEKSDLGKILDQGDVPLTASAKNFLEALTGRGTLDGGQPALSLTFDPKKGIAGALASGSTLEAIDLSSAPGERLHLEDTVELGTGDKFGKFMTGANAADFMKGVQEGDVIRYRTRDAKGNASDWVTVTAHTEGAAVKDTRDAVVALKRITLADAGGGKLSVANMETRPISEPGAKLQFTNVRTGEKTVVSLDNDGTFPAKLQLNGKAGDTFAVSASDGKNNLGFTQSVGTVSVAGVSTGGGGGKIDLPDPVLHKDQINKDGTPQYTTQRYTGPLFKDGVDMTDVVQGYLGDCYCPSAFAAMAKADPNIIKNAIQDNGDGTYTVTFKQRDWQTGTYKPVEVKVDGDLYTRSYGGPIYGSSSGDTSTGKMELWFPLMEKAWAQFKGGSEGYNGIGNGGMSDEVFEAIMGKRGTESDISSQSGDHLFAAVKHAIDGHLPISAGTYGDDEKAKYTNTGVYADHSYSVVGYKEEGGVKYVQLRNPWGESEPAGDGKDDGIFYLPMDKFQKLYQTLMTVEG
ncbi:MAG: hypothetical protein JST54_24020 [Deltaproteobacteria bacterium]|nr:hypothetical protein [Deltaproteobacteria bacterium]